MNNIPVAGFPNHFQVQIDGVSGAGAEWLATINKQSSRPALEHVRRPFMNDRWAKET
jgi:hypothetical protein